MRAMIPHHSNAILTSRKANLKDPKVKKLAQDVIVAQKRDISEMKKMIERLKNQ